jgi:DNA-binding NarL/FixJ family response regulator
MGLDWDKIRKEYAAKASPEELASQPFDENGNLSRGQQQKAQDEAVEAQRQTNRRSRAKTDPTPASRSGAMRTFQPGKGRGTSVPQTEVDAMIRLYREGISMYQIGKRLDRPSATVRNVLSREGVHKPRKKESHDV